MQKHISLKRLRSGGANILNAPKPQVASSQRVEESNIEPFFLELQFANVCFVFRNVSEITLLWDRPFCVLSFAAWQQARYSKALNPIIVNVNAAVKSVIISLQKFPL